MPNIIETIRLHSDSSSEGGKLYTVEIEEISDGEFIVTYENGPAKGTQRKRNKTPTPVSKERAHHIATALVKSKTSSTYSILSSQEPSSLIQPATQTTAEHTIFTMPLNVADDDTLAELLESESWAMQEKSDGERRVLTSDGSSVEGFSRYKVPKPVHKNHIEALKDHKVSLEGELVGDTLHLFDIRSIPNELNNNGTECVLNRPFKERWLLLASFLATTGINNNPNFKLTNTVTSAKDKNTMFNQLKDDGAEGVVFRDLDAHNVPSRTPQKNNGIYKWKFYETLSVIVSKHHDSKRSVSIHCLDDNSPVPVGNVTIPPHTSIPDIGDIVEIRYLYGFKGGSLFQPLYLRVRDDVYPSHCSTDQIKYKA